MKELNGGFVAFFLTEKQAVSMQKLTRKLKSWLKKREQSAPMQRQRFVSILRSTDELSRNELLEIQTALTRKLAGFPDVPAASTDRDTVDNQISPFLLHLLGGRVPTTEERDSSEHPQSRSGREPDYGGTMSMDIALAGVTSWSFDPFRVDQLTHHRPLSTLAFWIFRNDGCIFDLVLDELKLARFLALLENGYPDNPYHNRIHVCDVLQKVYMLINFGNFLGEDWTAEERFAAYFAAMIHDYKHPGVTNGYLIQTSDSIATAHNDNSVLENFHISEAFKLLQQRENNFIEAFSPQRYFRFRKRVIELVLGTDMSRHFENCRDFDENFRPRGIKPRGEKDSQEKSRSVAMKLMMKSADLGHCAAANRHHHRWVRLLQDEYYLQGDLEQSKGLETSPLMDRTKNVLENSQLEFFDVIVIPLYSNLITAFPDAFRFNERCRENRNKWTNSTIEENAAIDDADAAKTVSTNSKLQNMTIHAYSRITTAETLKPYFTNTNIPQLIRKQSALFHWILEKNAIIDVDMIKQIHQNLPRRPGPKEFDEFLNIIEQSMKSFGYSQTEIDMAYNRLISCSPAFGRDSSLK